MNADLTTSICSSSESSEDCSCSELVSRDVFNFAEILWFVDGGLDDDGRDDAGEMCAGLMCSVDP